MLTKCIIIAVTMKAILSQNKATAVSVNEDPRLVKLNTSPVCFGAEGNQYGLITNSHGQSIPVKSVVLQYRSGKVSCKKGKFSFWGCSPNSPSLGVLLTDQQNSVILAPIASTVSQNGWYELEGYTSSSPALVFCVLPFSIGAGAELHLWYGEDLTGYTESDNSGETCADVFVVSA